jgi:hypothetical protein
MGVYKSSLYCRGTDDNDKAIFEDLMKICDINPYNCPRFRAFEINTEEPLLCIRGRCGGGNREEYQNEIDEMESYGGFNRSWDCQDDNTYMCFEYTICDVKGWKELVDKYHSVDLMAEEQKN